MENEISNESSILATEINISDDPIVVKEINISSDKNIDNAPIVRGRGRPKKIKLEISEPKKGRQKKIKPEISEPKIRKKRISKYEGHPELKKERIAKHNKEYYANNLELVKSNARVSYYHKKIKNMDTDIAKKMIKGKFDTISQVYLDLLEAKCQEYRKLLNEKKSIKGENSLNIPI